MPPIRKTDAISSDLGQRRSRDSSRWLKAYGSTAIVSIVFVGLAVRLFRLISRYAVNIFFSDQWKFNDATLFQKHSLWEMFTFQHGPHRQGLGAWIEKLVDPLSHWNSRVESFVIGGVIVVGATAALWLRRRLFGPLTVFDIVIPAIFFIPGQWEVIFVTANFALGPMPVLLIVLYCLAWTCRRGSVRYPLVLLLNFFTLYTGFGLFVGVLTPFLLLLDHRARPRQARLPKPLLAGAVLVSLAMLGSFFIGYKFNADLECFSLLPRSPVLYASFIAVMFSNFFTIIGATSLSFVVGFTMLCALFFALAISVARLLRRQAEAMPELGRTRALVSLVLIAYCLLFCLNAAYGRSCGGLLMAVSPRYVPYEGVGVLGLYFYLLGVRSDRARKFLLTCLVAPVFAVSLYVDWHDIGYFAEIKRQWRACYLQTENISQCDQLVGFPIYTHAPEGTHLQEKLKYLKDTRQNLYSDSR
jgi:hypothetical protein